MDEKERVLVTGGAGFIGSHVVDRLVGSGYKVGVIDNLSEGKLSNIEGYLKNGRVRFFEGDIRDAKVVRQCIRDVDVVVHFAAITSVPFSVENPSLTFDINVNGTLNLLNACAKANVKRFVFVSSCSVYGEPSYLPIDEEHPTSPKSPYAVSKLEAEACCKSFEEKYGLGSTVLRLFNVYGPRQKSEGSAGVITQFVERVKRGQPLVIYGDGSQTRDFVHVQDVADAVLKAVEFTRINEEGGVFNISFGQATSLNRLAKAVLDLTNSSLEVVYEKPRVGDIKHSFADISKAVSVIDYKPIVSIDEGLQTCLADCHESARSQTERTCLTSVAERNGLV